MNDLSFLRLEPNFNEAKYTRSGTTTDIFYFGQIVLKPNSIYLQTTKIKNGIAFDGNYKVSVVDCNDLELLDITNNVAISEFVANGIPQINFEIVNIGKDFYGRTVFLKFEHTVSNLKWWTNPINITNYYDKFTSRFDYKNANDTLYQSIDLKAYFTVNDAESNSSEYVTYEGKKVSSRLINTELEKYVFQKIDNFTYRRLNNLLSRNVIYINGNRITDKQTIASDDPSGDTNVFNLDFKVAIDYNDAYKSQFQIFEPLQLIDLVPSGTLTLDTVGTNIIGTFNRNVILGSGFLRLFKDAELIETFNITDITITDNEFEISYTFTDNGAYYINFDTGLFISTFGEIYEGINNTTDWAFTIADGEYSATDYSNEYLIN